MNDRDDHQHTEKGWEPHKPLTGEEALTTEERSFDVGESGQFAPGGYYNQQAVHAPQKRSLDDDVVPPARR